jgi:hypothetical protein
MKMMPADDGEAIIGRSTYHHNVKIMSYGMGRRAVWSGKNLSVSTDFSKVFQYQI